MSVSVKMARPRNNFFLQESSSRVVLFAHVDPVSKVFLNHFPFNKQEESLCVVLLPHWYAVYNHEKFYFLLIER